ncbi:hypothetical protein C2G38_1959686, partial [Gigaspora rosea]
GDISALSKIMCVSGQNAYSGYRFCYFHRTYSEIAHHVYFPLHHPKDIMVEFIIQTNCQFVLIPAIFKILSIRN